MLRRTVLALLVTLSAALPARAEQDATAALLSALEIGRLVVVMEQEGLRHGRELEAELFPGQGGARWAATVARINDRGAMQAAVESLLRAALAGQPAEIEAAAAFFGGELGRRIIGLELAAREALLDEAMEEAAKLAWEDLRDARDPRVALLDRFVVVNDLIESNVAGAMTSNLSFYRGMIEGGALDPALAESEMMADLWSQEPQIRADTEEWLMPYLALAYQPLSDAELDAYIAYSETPSGQALNRAMFGAFDGLFAAMSRALGAEAARFAASQDL
jgi:hypothetical protein